MAFSKKTWKDRTSQYINRRLLTDSDGNTQQVTVTRDEGSVTEAGDAFSAANMNDLEDRIDAAFDGLTADDIEYTSGVSVADKLDTIGNDFTYNQEVKVGSALINGNTVDIYRYIATGTKSTASWGSAISNLPLDYGKVIKTLFSCKNTSGDNICSPYYVGTNDLFRAAVQKNGSQTDIYAQLGTSYPSMPATVIAEIYYYK